ncbi:metal-dependent hydrolase [Alteromonas lipolytica]|uniref:Hydrolase n=1 Tax=Alteromonas lipolytica TaxID=1856405 RepID=A0A1E8F8Z0_9ALTE|nr:metal-dependent hydrolase [Alteromonas lipolytica]OFI32389.1 hypothetical protein BFC17_06635 [Alteromonas lipolytica]GGF80223.1 hypothetical protein GCM10011338_35590 [Alteromonas lipolytica]
MDPFTHTFAGGLLASGGLRKVTPLAAAALLIGANIPDVDIVVSLMGEQASVAHRRGWTHGVLAWVVLPLILSAGLMLFANIRARIKPATTIEPSFWPLLGLSLLAVLSHPLLDWLNNYGVRLLMPFDNRWFYGDTLFVLDPWVWLLLGGGYCYATSARRWQQLMWAVFWVVSSAVVCLNNFSTTATIVVWFIGLSSLLTLRIFVPGITPSSVARLALILGVGYIIINDIVSRFAAARVADEMAARGLGDVADIMVAPVPANPFAGNVVVEFEDHYRLGAWHWLNNPHLSLKDEALTASMQDVRVQAAAKALAARRFLMWSRYPYATVTSGAEGGFQVQFDDARYAGEAGLIRGPLVVLDDNLQQIE